MSKDRREYFKKYRQENKEKISRYQKLYVEINEDKVKKRLKRWYKENREKVLSQQAIYLKNNRKLILARNLKWQKDHRKQVYEQQRKWREKRRLKNLAKRPKRIYLKPNENLEYENRFGGLREIVIQRDREKCQDCGLSRKKHKRFYGVDITVHHLNHKGRNSDAPEHIQDELITLCLRCHGKREN